MGKDATLRNLGKPRARFYLFFVLFMGALFFTFFINIALGSLHIPLDEVKNVLFYPGKGNSVYQTIIWKIRLPRSLATILGGAALSVSGLLFQVFFRNPLAGPFVLGVSSGASLFVALATLTCATLGFPTIYPLFLFLTAFLGSLISMVLVLSFAPKVKSVVTLLLIGLMISYFCSAISSALMAFAEKERVHGFVLWMMGSFSNFRWDEVLILGVVGVPLLLGAFLTSKPLNAFLLGENYARSMGVNLKLLRIIIVLLASLLAALITAFAGPVAFIGLAVPHIARLSLRTSDSKVLIPGVILLGAVATGFCDLAARLIFSPIELPISAVTSFFGAPIVIGLLLRRRIVL